MNPRTQAFLTNLDGVVVDIEQITTLFKSSTDALFHLLLYFEELQRNKF